MQWRFSHRFGNLVGGGQTDVDKPIIPYLSAIYFLPILTVPFSPFYSYIFCVFIMISLSSCITREYRILLSLNLIFSIALLYGSRLYFNIAPSYDDDFSRYYQNYLDVYDNIPQAMFVWGKGYEIGLPVFYKMLSLIFPKLVPQYVLFFTALSVALLLYVWLETYGVRYVRQEQRAALVAFSLFVGLFVESLGLTRQCFASVFLLYGFFIRPIYWKILFFAIALSFHQSSIFVIILSYFFYYFPRLGLLLFTGFLAFFISNSIIVNLSLKEFTPIFKSLGNVGLYFAAYIDSNGYNPLSLVNTNIIKVILMMAMCFVLYIVDPRDKVTRNFKTIILVCCVVYITHIFPVRIVMIVCDLTFCFILFVIFRHFFKLTLFFFFPYFLKLMYNYLINTDSPETNAIELFFSYPESSLYPFYYFFQGALL